MSSALPLRKLGWRFLAAMARRQRQVGVPRLRPLSPRQAAPPAREGRPGTARPGRSRGRLTLLRLLTQEWPEKPQPRCKTPLAKSALPAPRAGGNLRDFRRRATVLAQLYGRCSLKTIHCAWLEIGVGSGSGWGPGLVTEDGLILPSRWRCAEQSADDVITRSVEMILFSSSSHPAPELCFLWYISLPLSFL